jgi:outer membrane protein OmpA-like peptidoglycan-associated protein
MDSKPNKMIRDKLTENEHAGKHVNQANNNKKAALTPPGSWTKRPVPLLLGLLLTWIVIGAYLIRILCCISPATAFPLSITDGTTVVSAAEENLRFNTTKATPYISDSKIDSELQKAAKYVEDSEDKMLIVTGKYNTSELEKGSITDLGLLRAESIKGLFVGWQLDSNRILTKSEVSKLIVPVNDTVYGGVGFEIKDIPNRYMNFKAKGLDINKADNISFAFNSGTITQPVPKDVEAGARDLAEYFKANPKQKMQITGWYGVQENAGTDNLNLGRERANALKAWWISKGIPANQIKVIGAEERNDIAFVKGQLYGGAIYNIGGETSNEGNLSNNNQADKSGIANISSTDIVNIYFDKNSDIPNMTALEIGKLAQVVQYLKANQAKNLIIKGYASIEGNPVYNKRLSEQRGKAVKRYLVSKGVTAKQINVAAFGATVTTAKNDSETERSKDRRAELTIK